MKCLVAGAGMWIWEMESAPAWLRKAGQYLFELGEEEYVKRQYEQLQAAFADMKTDERYSVSGRNLEFVAYVAGVLEAAVKAKEEAWRYAKKYRMEELNLGSRSSYYRPVYLLEKKMLKWIRTREMHIKYLN